MDDLRGYEIDLKFWCKSDDLAKALVNPEITFRRAFIFIPCECSRYDCRQVLLYPLHILFAPIPAALVHDDGNRRKCCKSDIINLLEEKTCSSFNLPSFDKLHKVLIRDVMGIIKSTDAKKCSTFWCSFTKLTQNSIQLFILILKG